MSYTGCLKLDLSASISVPNSVRLLEALLASGWSLDNGVGRIELSPRGPYEPGESTVLPIAETAQAIEILRHNDAAREQNWVTLTTGSASVEARFFFPSAPDRPFVIFPDARRRRTLPDAPRFSDTSWYVSQFARALKAIGLGIYRVQLDEF